MPVTHGLGAYLEGVYILHSEGVPAIGARLADLLGVKPPSVTEAMHRLTKQGLALMDARHVFTLTEEGWRHAEGMMRRHRIAERWLTDVVGLDWAQADVEALKLQHAFSEEVADRLSAMMSHPKTCPHGNPIPGNWETPSYYGLLLTEAAPGSEVVVERILEHAEVDFRLLRYLWDHGILPGAHVVVGETIPGGGTLAVTRDGQEVILGLSAAAKIQVRPAEAN